MTSRQTGACENCGSRPTKLKSCSRCKVVFYCNASCQKRSWPLHKRTCAAASSPVKDPSSRTTTEGAPRSNHASYRLEMKRNGGSSVDNEKEVWEDAGPINLLPGDGASFSSSLPRDQSRDELNVKTLPPSLRKYLGDPGNYTYHHSMDKIDSNLVIFLHGAGDTHHPFSKLGQTMQLPQTACLSLHANCLPTKMELPFDLGCTWFQEMDYTTGLSLEEDHPRRLSTLDEAVGVIHRIVKLLGNEGSDWGGCPPGRIFVFGFGAGACLAMESALMWDPVAAPLGGVVCVSGGIRPRGRHGAERRRDGTPVLILAGSEDESYPPSVARTAATRYEESISPRGDGSVSSSVAVHVRKNRGSEMISSPDEMRVVMVFFAERLVRRMVGMERNVGMPS